MEYCFVLLAIMLIAFIQRVFLGFLMGESYNFDTQFHLFYIKYVRENGLKSKVTNRLVFPQNILSYPWLYHYLLSFLPQNFIEKYCEKYLNSFLDAVFTGIMFSLSLYLTNSLRQSIYLVLLYIFTPIFFTLQSLGPRVASMTPRLMGEIMVNVVFIIELFPLCGFVGWGWIIALSSLLGCFIFVTSKFSIQAFVFLSLALSVFSKNLYPIIVVFFSFVCAILFFREKVFFLLQYQYDHLKWYFKKNRAKKVYVSTRNSLSELFKIAESGDIKALYKYLMLKNTISIVLVKYPIFVIAFYVTFFKNEIVVSSPLLIMSKCFVLSGLAVFVLTSLRPLLFLGEAERYLLHIVFFVLVLAVSYISSPWWIIGLCIYGMAFMYTDFLFLKSRGSYANISFDEQDAVVKYLKNIKETKNVLTIPFHFGGWRIVNQTQHNWFYIWDFSKDITNDLLDVYPFINLANLSKIVRKNDIELILIHEKATGQERLSDMVVPSTFRLKKQKGFIVLEKSNV